MRRIERQDEGVPAAGTPLDRARSGTGIGRSRRLDKGRPRGLSNSPRAGPNSPRAGRGLLVLVALAFVAGLLWLWLGQGERPAGRIPAPGAEEAPLAEPPPAELLPAEALPSDPPVGTGDELAPFIPGRAVPAVPAGRVGSVRGHVEVSGEEPFPAQWRLVLRPSLTLPDRESAVERSVEFGDGRKDFEVMELPLGGYDVRAEAVGFNGQIAAVLLEPGNEHPFVNLRMVPAGLLEGRVLDSAGLPAEGVPLTLFAAEDRTPREAVSDVSGVYRFPSLVDGNYELVVGRPTAPIVRERHPVRFLAPHLTFPDIELPLLGEIHVRIVDSLERPLEGVEVRGSGTNGGIVEGKTDFLGRLVVRHLPAGHFRMRLSHAGFDEQYARRIAVDVEAGAIAEAPVRFGPP